jgi:hypothetical protein
MNNYQELPIRWMTLENKFPDAFETVRHYGPYLVIDALAAILGQITSLVLFITVMILLTMRVSLRLTAGGFTCII